MPFYKSVWLGEDVVKREEMPTKPQEKNHNTTAFVTLGASNHTVLDRQEHDFYATEPRAIELLLKEQKFSDNVWECACGQGHLSEVLKNNGYNVYSTDLIDRGYGDGVVDFLATHGQFDGDIITNPPYVIAQEFIEHALKVVTEGRKVVMFLRLAFLEGKGRKSFFQTSPLKYVYVASGRLSCARDGDFDKWHASAIAMAWFIWEKGYKGEPTIRWFN